ncbi:MAG: SPFH domain-containing protein, partial [Pseudomonadales bacterium]
MSAMPMNFLLAGVVLAGTIIASAAQVRSLQLRIGAAVLAVVVLCAFFTLASFRFVDANSIGLVTKNIGLVSLPSDKIIATEGEKGWQATTLAPGWHPWYWPFIYKIDMQGLTTVPAGSVGLLNAKDGQPLPRDTTYAPEWNEDDKGRMSDAEFFLGDGSGHKGPQTSVLNPATYRINPRLFELKIVPVTTVEKASVGVVKSNVGTRPIALEGEEDTSGQRRLVTRGQRGIWREPLLEGQYYLNTDAYQVTPISTKKHIIRYTAGEGQRTGGDEENEINVITSDGFDFPVDVRIVYEIEPRNAPLLVASVGDDQKGLRDVMNLAVRSIFRNNAQGVKAL